MANSILIKRSSVAAKVPTVGDLQLGELAINTSDGKLFLKKNNGADSIVEVGAVTSVAGRTGAVVLTSSDVAEGTRLYYTDARARASVSVAGVGLSYNSTTGAISSNATNANTASTIMARDANGSFSGGTAYLTGLFTTSPVALNGATGSYSGYSSGLTLNYTGNNSQYAMVLKPATSTLDTTAVSFLSSASTYATAIQLASIQHLANDAGMNLTGSWKLGGVNIATTASSISGTASNVTGTVAIANGGTAATSAEAAATNLGVAKINPTTAKTGDVRVNAGVISMYDGSAWKQVFPAVYA